MLSWKLKALIVGMILLVGCEPSNLRITASSPVATMISQSDWEGALSYYESRLEADPANAEFRGGYFSVVEQAVD